MPAGLGRLLLNQQPPGSFTVEDHGEPDRGPGLGVIGFVGTRVGDGRSIAVRIPFTDDRADDFLRREARQLPSTGPGLLMFSLGVGDVGAWEKLLRRRFDSPRHRRVSGVCVFTFAQAMSPEGQQWRREVRLVQNPHAHVSLPLWAQGLKAFEIRDDIRSRLTAKR